MTLLISNLCYSKTFNACNKQKSRDYRKLWPKKSIRNQCGVGSCHSFQSIGMVEAAHSLLFDRNIDLSENDLFRQHMKVINKGKKPSQFISDLANETYKNKKTDSIFREGGHIYKDIELMKKNGTCFERTLPYENDWGYRSKGYQALKCMRKSKKQIVGEATSCRINKTNDFSNLQGLCNDVAKTFKVMKVDEILTENPSNKCLEERKKVKQFVKALKLHEERFKKNETYQDKKTKLLSYLRCQPVGVSVKGYASIKNKKSHSSHDSGHALIIAGYDCKTNKFIMRNSWGGDYEEVDADLLANGTYILSVLSKDGNKPDASGKCPDVKSRESFLAKSNAKPKFKMIGGVSYNTLSERPHLNSKGEGFYGKYYYKNGVATKIVISNRIWPRLSKEPNSTNRLSGYYRGFYFEKGIKTFSVKDDKFFRISR
jgi:hypothetical protein